MNYIRKEYPTEIVKKKNFFLNDRLFVWPIRATLLQQMLASSPF